MRNSILITILIAFFSGTVFGQSNTYSLEQAIQYSLENSDNLKNSKLDVEAAKYEVGKIRSAGLPQVNASVGLNYNYSIRKSLLPASTFDPNAPQDLELELAFGTKYDGDANIALSQLLFDGSYFVGLQAAKMYKLYSEQELTQTKIDVIDAVTKSYYMVLINKVRYERLKGNEERLAQLLNETEALYKNGFAEKIDVSRIQVSYNNILAQSKQMKRLIELSEYMLKMQMGLNVEEPIELSDKIADLPKSLKEQKVETDFNYTNRIDYQLLNSGEQLQKLDIRNYKVQYYPNLYLNGVYGHNTNAVDFSQYSDFSNRWLRYGLVGVSLNVPIFDGLRKSYSIQKSKVELEKIENQRHMMENAIETEIKQKRDALANSIELMEVQKLNYDLAEEIYNTTDIKFQEGVGSNLELVDANNSLMDAEAIYFDALYNAVVAKTELEKALGLYNDF
ncbi:TolC family protein [Hyphobacterium sp. CCMP332]|nr:TolC family protein [Hyphobacterium sp. CCMP332]